MTERPTFHKRNHQFGCWMDPDLWEWFLQYLDKYSIGESRSEKFGVLLYELQKIGEKGITITNPKQSNEAAYVDKPHLKIPTYLICMKPHGTEVRQQMSNIQRNRQCFLLVLFYSSYFCTK